MLKDNYNYTVAHTLAIYNKNWLTFKRKVLTATNIDWEENFGIVIFDNKKHVYYDKIYARRIFNKVACSVAGHLAINNPNWLTIDREILSLKSWFYENVATSLLRFNPRWCFYTNLINTKRFTEICLEKKKYIASRVKKNILSIIPII